MALKSALLSQKKVRKVSHFNKAWSFPCGDDSSFTPLVWSATCCDERT